MEVRLRRFKYGREVFVVCWIRRVVCCTVGGAWRVHIRGRGLNGGGVSL
jgi:hypothetical protein